MRRALFPLSLVSLLLLVTGGKSLLSQEVRGQVRDRTTNQPVPVGVITLVTADGRLIASTAAGPQGQYVLPAPGPGTYLLQYVGPGYAPHVSSEFTLARDQRLILPLEISPLPRAALDPVIVEGRPVPSRLAGFYQRQATGLGDHLTREQIEELNPRVSTDLLRRTAAVSVQPISGGAMRVAGRRDPARCASLAPPMGPLIFLDGMLLGNGMELDLDALVPVQDLEGVEVYGGAATLPPEFDRPGSHCGVVAFWTRSGAPRRDIAVERHFELGGQTGGWIASAGMREGRVGARASLDVAPPVEATLAVNFLIRGYETRGAGTDRTGTQLMLGLRGRPLGRDSPWYLGGGMTFLSAQTSDLSSDAEDRLMLMSGLALPVRAFRPFFELQLLSPHKLGEAQLHFFTGVTVRLY